MSSPTHPYTINDLSDEQLEAFVAALQQRRMEQRREFEESERLRNEKMLARTRDELDHVRKVLAKDFEIVEKRLNKMQERLVKIRVLRGRIRGEQMEEELAKETVDEIGANPQ